MAAGTGGGKVGGQFRKPEWLDSAVGIAGLVLSVGSILALMTGSDAGLRIVVLGALGMGVAVILLAVLFRPRHALREIEPGQSSELIKAIIVDGSEVIVLNPSPDRFDIRPYVDMAIERGVPIHVVGGAPLVERLFEGAGEHQQKSFVDFVRLTDSVSDELMICITSRGNTQLSLFVFLDSRVFLFKLTDAVTVPMIGSLLKRDDDPSRSYLSLKNVAHARSFLSAVTDEQKRFLENFSSLRRGSIAFHGTQVQQVQSGLIETKRYKGIDTLDVTTNPNVLLQRKRYIEVNRHFIAEGGRIRRVFMAQESDLKDPQFRDHLQQLVRLQREIKADIGLIYIDDIPENKRNDFILYDDAVVLVEDRQAYLDYSLGRSTAYFGTDKIRGFREDFDRVWNGTLRGKTPQQTVLELFP